MDIRVISRAKSSEQNDDKTNNLDDVILHQRPHGTQQHLLLINRKPRMCWNIEHYTKNSHISYCFV